VQVKSAHEEEPLLRGMSIICGYGNKQLEIKQLETDAAAFKLWDSPL